MTVPPPRGAPRPAGERRSVWAARFAMQIRSRNGPTTALTRPRGRPRMPGAGDRHGPSAATHSTAVNRHCIRRWRGSRNRVGPAEMGSLEHRGDRQAIDASRRGRLGVATASGGAAGSGAPERDGVELRAGEARRWGCVARTTSGRACGGGCGCTRRAGSAMTCRRTTGPRRRSRRTSPPAASRTRGRRSSRAWTVRGG